MRYPEDPDLLTEGALTFSFGAWKDAEVETALLPKVGTFSVRTAGEGGIMWFIWFEPVDLSLFEHLFFYGALAPEPYGNDRFSVTLRDADYHTIYRELFIPPVKIWQEIDLPLKTGWTGDVEAFNWARLSGIAFSCVAGQVAYADAVHFYRFEAVPPKTWVRLRCEGVASAQCVVFHGEYSETVMVPTDFTVSPAGVWGFRALGEMFEYWMVNGVRYDEKEIQVNLEEGSDTTLTMHYTFKPPSLPDIALALGIISVLLCIGGVIYSGVKYFME